MRFFCVLFRTTSLRSVAPFVLMIPRLFGAWSFCLYSINTQINYYIFTRKCCKTQKRLKTPWPGVFNRGIFRACLANFHTNMWRTRTKAAENRPCAAKCGGTWKNPHQKATFLHENVAKHTKKQLKIDSSQGPNTMAWRVQPRRFSSMSGVKTLRLNPL